MRRERAGPCSPLHAGSRRRRSRVALVALLALLAAPGVLGRVAAGPRPGALRSLVKEIRSEALRAGRAAESGLPLAPGAALTRFRAAMEKAARSATTSRPARVSRRPRTIRSWSLPSSPEGHPTDRRDEIPGASGAAWPSAIHLRLPLRLDPGHRARRLRELFPEAPGTWPAPKGHAEP